MTTADMTVYMDLQDILDNRTNRFGSRTTRRYQTVFYRVRRTLQLDERVSIVTMGIHQVSTTKTTAPKWGIIT